MAEALICARNVTHTDSIKNLRGCYKRGMIVTVKPDGHEWGAKETPVGKTAAERLFVLFKFPGVSVGRIEKYIAEQFEIDQFTGERLRCIRRRLWRIRWDDLPLSARQKLIQDGIISIGPVPPNDYTWNQVKGYIYNHAIDSNEDGNL